jgi:hypothetical protein
MKLTDLPNDAIVLILARLERAHDIARMAKACRMLRDAAGLAQGARRRLCKEQFLAMLRSMSLHCNAAAADAAVKLVTSERVDDQFAAAEVAASVVDDAFREAPPERHHTLMIFIKRLLNTPASRWTPIARPLQRQQRSRFIGPLVKRLPRILEIAFASATEQTLQTAPELKFVAAQLRFVSWDPDLHDALDRFVPVR